MKKNLINKVFAFLKNENRRQYIKVHLDFIKNVGLAKYINTNLEYVLSLYPKNFDTNLSIVAIVKNETPYIKEWIEYHKIVGVEKFYIYDNDSVDNLKETLQSYIDTGEVIYEHYSGQGVQMSAYQKAIDMYKNHSRYIAFVDIDEFITPIMHDTIPEFIAYFEQNICKNPASIGINWLMHGFNGHNKKPQGLVCENFCRCDYATGANQHVKSIVNPRSVLATTNPHFFIHKWNAKVFNSKGKKMQGPFTNINHDVIYINHYWLKSFEEHKKRVSVGRADAKIAKQLVPYEPNYLSKDENHSMDRFIPILKEKLSINVDNR